MNDDRINPTQLTAKDSLPGTVADAIDEVLWYLWQEAIESFIADESGPGEGHIFRALVAVDGWFYGHDEDPEEIVSGLLTDDERAAARRRGRSCRG